MREGVLSPTRPLLKGMTRLKPLPTTDAHRKRLHTPKPVKPPKPFAPTIRQVKEIVPNKLIPKLKSMTPLQARKPPR